jgi:hypothetical protein
VEASSENEPKEVYLALIGDCGGECNGQCAKAKPLIFSTDGAIMFRPEQIKSFQGMEGRRIGPDGPTGKVQKLLVINSGMRNEQLFIVREVLHEPSEIDAICRVSNIIGE